MKTDPPTTDNMTTVISTSTSKPDISTSTNKPEPQVATQASRISPPNSIWHLLTIIFGVGFALCLVITSICLFVMCRRHIAEKSMGEKDKLRPPAQTDETGLDNMGATTDNDTV